MIRFKYPLPKKYWIAVSGGIDSMAVLHWLHHNKPNRRDSLLGILHVNHNTGCFADEAFQLIQSVRDFNKWPAKFYLVEGQPPEGESKEAWWREQRYKFFHSFSEPVLLAHTFDDCLEEYIMCSMVRGYSGTIPYRNGNCIRPFRLWKRKDIENYMKWYGFYYVEDPSNSDDQYKRNYIRKHIVPHILKINPGVYNLVEKAMEKQDEHDNI